MNDLPRTQALRCFITVAREGTVSRAASMLNLTQPAVSLQLKGLEESTGLQLFNRTPGGFTLTEAGEIAPAIRAVNIATVLFRATPPRRPSFRHGIIFANFSVTSAGKARECSGRAIRQQQRRVTPLKNCDLQA